MELSCHAPDASPSQYTALPDWVLSWLLLGLVVLILGTIKSLLAMWNQWQEMRQDHQSMQRALYELSAQVTNVQNLLQQAVLQQGRPSSGGTTILLAATSPREMEGNAIRSVSDGQAVWVGSAGT